MCLFIVSVVVVVVFLVSVEFAVDTVLRCWHSSIDSNVIALSAVVNRCIHISFHTVRGKIKRT